MRKRKIKKSHILIIIIAIIITVLLFFSSTLKPGKKQTKFTSLIKDTVTGVEKIVAFPFNFIFDTLDDFKNLKNIKKKYQTLLPQVERIASLETENLELRKQLNSLKNELQIENTLNEYEYLNATVINRNITTWYNIITVDKGSYNGVTPDMVVVNSSGLIGKVISTTTFTSDVRLITTSDTNNKISIRVSDGKNSVNGLIKNYNYKTGLLEVEGISNTEKIGPDAYVYTSGLGGIFPSGILIGRVTDIKTDEYDLAKMLDVTPVANFDDINYVAILKRKELKKWSIL